MASLPVFIHIAPSDIPSASSGTWTLSAWSTGLGGMRLVNGGTQNDYIEWPICTAGGVWRLSLIHYASSNRGIATVSVDGASVGTLDCYNASSVDNTVLQLSPLTLTAGNHLLRFTMETKHASSTGYYMDFRAVGLLRTGA